MRHIAIAVDKLANTNDAMIVNIAWCLFDDEPGNDVIRFRHVHLEAQENTFVDIRHVRWYMEQEESIRGVFANEGDHLNDILTELNDDLRLITGLRLCKKEDWRRLGLKVANFVDVQEAINSLRISGIAVYPDFQRADKQVEADVATLRAIWNLTKSHKAAA